MKKVTVLVFALLVLGIRVTCAQNFRAALVAGLAATQVDGDQLNGYHKGGLCVGALTNLKLNDKFSSQVEFLYLQKGSRTAIDTTGTLPYYRLRLNYIEIPWMFLYHYPIKKNTALLEAGLSAGTLLKTEEETNYYTTYPGVGFYKTDYSLNLGMSFGFAKRFFFAVRYSYSLFPIRVGRETPPRHPFQNGQKNNVLAFTLRYYLRAF